MKPFGQEAQTSQIQENRPITFDSPLKITVCLGGRVLELKADPDYPRVCVPRGGASVAGTVMHNSTHYLTSSRVVCLCCVGIRPPRHVISSRSVTRTQVAKKSMSGAGHVCGESWGRGGRVENGDEWRWNAVISLYLVWTPCKDPHNGRVREGLTNESRLA